MKNRFRFLYKLIKDSKRGKLYLSYYLLASLTQKIILFTSLGLFKINLKKKVYKSYIKYRLKNN